jgi:hypothetical protein
MDNGYQNDIWSNLKPNYIQLYSRLNTIKIYAEILSNPCIMWLIDVYSLKSHSNDMNHNWPSCPTNRWNQLPVSAINDTPLIQRLKLGSGSMGSGSMGTTNYHPISSGTTTKYNPNWG